MAKAVLELGVLVDHDERRQLPPRSAFVPGDCREPRRGLPRRHAVQQGAMRGEEHLLRCILGLFAVAQEQAADRRDEPVVLAVKGIRVGGCSILLRLRWWVPHGDSHYEPEGSPVFGSGVG